MERIWVVLASFLMGCLAGDGGVGGGGKGRELRSDVEFVHDEGLEGSVVVDSLGWLPFVPVPGFGGAEFEGFFVVDFRNVGEERVWVRYDLRFFDREDFLVDAFIPFGQPVELEAGETERVEGAFRVRAADPRDFERLSLMRLVVRVRWPEE